MAPGASAGRGRLPRVSCSPGGSPGGWARLAGRKPSPSLPPAHPWSRPKRCEEDANALAGSVTLFAAFSGRCLRCQRPPAPHRTRRPQRASFTGSAGRAPREEPSTASSGASNEEKGCGCGGAVAGLPGQTRSPPGGAAAAAAAGGSRTLTAAPGRSGGAAGVACHRPR